MIPNVQKLNSGKKCCKFGILLRRYGRHIRICNVEIIFFEKIFFETLLNKEGLALLNVYGILVKIGYLLIGDSYFQ